MRALLLLLLACQTEKGGKPSTPDEDDTQSTQDEGGSDEGDADPDCVTDAEFFSQSAVPLLGNPLAVVHAAQGLSDASMAAFARAVTERWSCSDDVQVMERAGHRVALVLGDARNLKLTTPDDWAVAEALIG
jgi:hypothetical protein